MTNRLELLLQLHTASPTDLFTLFAIAKEYEKADQPAEALTYYNHLKAIDPSYVGLYYHLGKLYEAAGQPDEAINTYAQGIAIARQSGDMHALSELNGAKMNLEMEL